MAFFEKPLYSHCLIGQRLFKQDSYVHWLMLRFGIKIKSSKEVLGQIPRLMVGGVKSFVGKIPVGNTGGANCAPFTTNGDPR